MSAPGIQGCGGMDAGMLRDGCRDAAGCRDGCRDAAGCCGMQECCRGAEGDAAAPGGWRLSRQTPEPRGERSAAMAGSGRLLPAGGARAGSGALGGSGSREGSAEPPPVPAAPGGRQSRRCSLRGSAGLSAPCRAGAASPR